MFCKYMTKLDSGFRRNDGKVAFPIFYERIIMKISEFILSLTLQLGKLFPGRCLNDQLRLQSWMMVPFLKCLAGGLPHFMELRNGGPDGPERSEGNSEGGGSARRIASRQSKRAGITRP